MDIAYIIAKLPNEPQFSQSVQSFGCVQLFVTPWTIAIRLLVQEIFPARILQ